MTLSTVTLAALCDSRRQIAVPFRVSLPDNSMLECSEILRVLPGKRIVARATHNGNPVVAKIFFQIRNLQQETDGYQLLQTTGVRTPALLRTIPFDEGGICLYAFLPDAIAFDAVWRRADPAHKTMRLQELLAILAQLANANVFQTDLHPGNFLYSGDSLFALDPASYTRDENDNASGEMLALLLAQFSPPDWTRVADGIGAHFPAVTKQALKKRAREKWEARKNNYLGKIFRDCTEIADVSTSKLRILCRREALSEELRMRLRQPQALSNGAKILKDGNSAKVYLIEVDDRKLVVKQYINKDWLRKIRRAFQKSRAARSWYFSRLLLFAGIATPESIALIERKAGPLVTESWFVSEYISAECLLDVWQREQPMDWQISAIKKAFAIMQILGISHGDMKATNILCQEKCLQLIDFDGAKQHLFHWSALQAINADKNRFLQNWKDNNFVMASFKEWIKN